MTVFYDPETGRIKHWMSDDEYAAKHAPEEMYPESEVYGLRVYRVPGEPEHPIMHYQVTDGGLRLLPVRERRNKRRGIGGAYTNQIRVPRPPVSQTKG